MLDVSELLAGLAALTVVLGGIGGGLAWLKRWLRQQVAEPTQAAAQQLATSNGRTVAQYVEGLTGDLESLTGDLARVSEELKVLSGWATQNRELANTGILLAKQAHERLDMHLTGHGKAE